MRTEQIIIELLSVIDTLLKERPQATIAIDGRCASGKTTLAKALQRELDCSLVHMDHFYLQPHQRTEQRFEHPGGNVDMERFSAEVLDYILEGKSFSYQPFDCEVQDFSESIYVPANGIYIIEGVYSCLFAEHCILKIFMTVSEEQQLSRLKKRNPAILGRFQQEWIPMEEKYFEFFKVEQLCDLVFSTG